MSINHSVEVVCRALQPQVQTGTIELIFRELSFDPQRSIYSAVMIIRAQGRDKGYIWIDGNSDLVCCHSTAVSTGPLSSLDRKPFPCKERDLKVQLNAAISNILRARSSL
jgi:hypothetical protein